MCCLSVPQLYHASARVRTRRDRYLTLNLSHAPLRFEIKQKLKTEKKKVKEEKKKKKQEEEQEKKKQSQVTDTQVVSGPEARRLTGRRPSRL